MDCSTGLKLLCLSWLVPGVALTWIGFGSMGIRTAATPLAPLEMVQAISALLFIFAAVMAAMWMVRVGDQLPTYRRPRSRRPARGYLATAVLGLVALAALVAARTATGAGSASGPWYAIAAGAGFFFALGLLRPLAGAPVARPATVMAFAAACIYQVTVGWLHLLDPAGPYAITIVGQGLALIWTATAATREVGATQRLVRLGRRASISREQAPLPLAGPAVGH